MGGGPGGERVEVRTRWSDSPPLTGAVPPTTPPRVRLKSRPWPLVPWEGETLRPWLVWEGE